MRCAGNLLSAIVVLCGSLVWSSAAAQEGSPQIKQYGPFIYAPSASAVLFFVGQINEGDSFALRRALRNHEIDTIVLISDGGAVWESLTIAGIINDRKMSTYIPKDFGRGCLSACSYIFFAGESRIIDGKLGVHQLGTYNDPIDKKPIEMGRAQQYTQLAVSQVIGFLREFGTPSFVLEKMFRSRDMYIFTNAEGEMLERGSIDQKKVASIEAVLAGFANDIRKSQGTDKDDDGHAPVGPDVIKKVQRHLNRIGCNAGVVDGIWGEQTQAAAKRFATAVGIKFSGIDSIDLTFIKMLEHARKDDCGEIVTRNIHATLGGVWLFSLSCDNGELEGRARVYAARAVDDVFFYSLEFTNSRGGEATGFLKAKGRAVSYSLNGTAGNVTGRGVLSDDGQTISGESSDGCEFYGTTQK